MDSKLVIPTVTAKDWEKAKEVIESYCGQKRMVWPNQVAVFEDLMLGMRGEIAHALASQREEDARVAENWIPDPHKEHEPCQDCATARGICDAIRRGGE